VGVVVEGAVEDDGAAPVVTAVAGPALGAPERREFPVDGVQGTGIRVLGAEDGLDARPLFGVDGHPAGAAEPVIDDDAVGGLALQAKGWPHAGPFART